MKIRNRQMVGFLNISDSILQLKIPKKLYSAISLNRAALMDAADTYISQQQKLLEEYVKKGNEGQLLRNGNKYAFTDESSYYNELEELLVIEIDVNLQTVHEELFDQMDSMEKFDSLSGIQYAAIGFMVEENAG